MQKNEQQYAHLSAVEVSYWLQEWCRNTYTPLGKNYVQNLSQG